MAVSTARRLDPAQPTPFADAALALWGYGLALVPLGGDVGKVPLIKWKNLKYRPGRQ